MIEIPLTQLRSRADNANVMPEGLLVKLAGHIERTDRYPHLIVRPMPGETGAYEILDGHHRTEALRRLGRTAARCEVWEVDDDEALVLLATLNRLQGRDEVRRRADLLESLRQRFGEQRLPQILPEDAERLERLRQVRLEPPAPAPSIRAGDLPVAVTFFLTPAQKRRLDEALSGHAGTRSQQLVAHLRLDADAQPHPQPPARSQT
ncbi:MAG: ParB/RepB/Spo0J family partition protein [Phycisphaerales bacterium]|nr:ParB/RepB/Spo0J family partition protein [Phycisphaerales bacterium]